MAPLVRDVFDLPWPAVAVVVTVVVGVAVVLTAAMVTLGLWIITRVPPFRYVIVGVVTVLTKPYRDWNRSQIDTLLDDKLEPIIAMVNPNGGTSVHDYARQGVALMGEVSDKQDRISEEIEVVRAVAFEANERATRVDDQFGQFAERITAAVDELRGQVQTLEDEVHTSTIADGPVAD